MRLDLRAPIILMVLAATAVPVELRSPGALGFSIQPFDVLQNVLGYIPIGIVLAGLSPSRGILAATLISVLAESSQFVMMHRDPSIVDVVANAIGGSLGWIIGRRWKIPSHAVLVNRRRALAAGVLAIALMLGVRATSGDALSARGATAAGTLEGDWPFDESDGIIAMDGSGHDLRGILRNDPVRVDGARGRALQFDGARSYVDFDRPQALRLVGSLTISAWIKARAVPIDDAAIVSTMRHVGGQAGDTGFGVGYQLDTTIDTGPRTIGFKFTNQCGALVSRFGATPLRLDRWYHVAGVYDATARTVDVYLNGQPDNGALRGTVQASRRSSREPMYVGRRSDLGGYEFSGTLDEVRIYSRALTPQEVAADMRGRAAAADGSGTRVASATAQEAACSWTSEREDARIPGAVATVGVLVAIACIGLFPGGGALVGLAVSVVAGAVLFRVATPTLPTFNLWLFPLTALAGAASVVMSTRRLRPEA